MRSRRLDKMRRLAALLLGTALILGGCGAAGGSQSGGEPGDGIDAVSLGGGRAEGDGAMTVMGRYVEQEIPYAENSGLREPAALLGREDGVYLLDLQGMDAEVKLAGKTFDGQDGAQGPTIENVNCQSALPGPLYGHVTNNDYFTGMAMAENGARFYSIFSVEGTVYCHDKYFLDAAGNETVWDAGGEVPRESMALCRAGDDGCFYVLTADEDRRLYRVDSESGETAYVMDLSWIKQGIGNIAVFGGRLFVATYEPKLRIFDLATGEELEEEKRLNELLGSALDKNNGYYSYGFLLYPGADGSVYVATDRGLYRHVLYGNVTELLIDGTLCSLGDISKLFVDMYVDEAAEDGTPVFYFLYDSGKLLRFAYDPETPSMPEQTLTLYSLVENNEIRLAITAYQARHPEVYVRYEIGMSGQDGVTREDALGSLATGIAAGEGPDLFLLDGLPYKSYSEKGVLADLGGLYEDLGKERQYFDNVVAQLREDGALYMIPLVFHVPLLIGDQAALEEIGDAESMARAIEQSHVSDRSLRAGLLNAKNTIRSLACVNSGSWLKEGGSLDREALKRFLELCKRLYEADRADISPQNLELREDMVWAGAYEEQMYQVSREVSNAAMNRRLFGDGFGIGLQGGDVRTDFNVLYALLQTTGAGYKLLPGEEKACVPSVLLGVNAATPIPEEAERFVRFMLTDYLEEAKTLSGVPIRKDALLAMERDSPKKDEDGNPVPGPYMGYAFSAGGDLGADEIVSYEVEWLEPGIYEKYNAMLDSLDAVCLCDYELLSAVVEEGDLAVRGLKPIEEAVDAIAKKVQIYLAE